MKSAAVVALANLEVLETHLEDFAQYYAQYYEDADTENFDADAFVQQWVPTRDVDMGPPPDDDNDGDNNDDAGDDDAAN